MNRTCINAHFSKYASVNKSESDDIDEQEDLERMTINESPFKVKAKNTGDGTPFKLTVNSLENSVLS